MSRSYRKDIQYYKFCLYGFLKNQRFFEPFLLLIFLREKGVDYTGIGTLYAIRFVLRTVFEIPSGMMADSMGRKGVMLFSYTCYMVSFVAYYYAPDFAWLILPTVLFAVGDAFRTGTHKSMIFVYLKKHGWQNEKTDYYGHTRAWSQTGSAISSILAAGFVLLSNNYNSIFLLSLAPYLIGFILLASYPGYLNGKARESKSLREYMLEFKKVFQNSVIALSNARRLKLTINVSSYSGFFHAAKDYLQVIISSAVVSIPLYVNLEKSDNEKEIILIGLIYFVLYFITAAASRSSGLLVKRFGSEHAFLNVMLLIGLFTALLSGIFYQLNWHIAAVLVFLLILVIENFRRPAGVSIIADQFSEDIHASILSAQSQLSSVMAAVISFIIGVTADKFGPGIGLIIPSVLILAVFPLIRIKTD